MRITRSDAVENDDDDGELQRIGIERGTSAFYLIEGGFGTERFQDRFLASLPSDECYLVDNDHGNIADVKSFRKLLADGINWLEFPGR